MWRRRPLRFSDVLNWTESPDLLWASNWWGVGFSSKEQVYFASFLLPPDCIASLNNKIRCITYPSALRIGTNRLLLYNISFSFENRYKSTPIYGLGSGFCIWSTCQWYMITNIYGGPTCQFLFSFPTSPSSPSRSTRPTTLRSARTGRRSESATSIHLGLIWIKGFI